MVYSFPSPPKEKRRNLLHFILSLPQNLPLWDKISIHDSPKKISIVEAVNNLIRTCQFEVYKTRHFSMLGDSNS